MGASHKANNVRLTMLEPVGVSVCAMSRSLLGSVCGNGKGKERLWGKIDRVLSRFKTRKTTENRGKIEKYGRNTARLCGPFSGKARERTGRVAVEERAQGKTEKHGLKGRCVGGPLSSWKSPRYAQVRCNYRV